MSKWAYYNDNDPQVCAWVRELIKRGLVTAGEVDARDIKDVRPGDLAGFQRCHFFCGIAVWDYALNLAGWADDLVWTGSCPCQPFSAAGQGKGLTDARHLWPDWLALIRECRPPVIFGEQVSSPAGLEWLDLVSTGLEAEGYACGAADLAAAGVGAPHIRQRLYFVGELADRERARWERGQGPRLGVSPTGKLPDGGKAQMNLPTAAKLLAAWPTPCGQDGPKGGPSQGEDRLPGAADLTSWPTPTATERSGQGEENASLLQDAKLASWPTPTSRTNLETEDAAAAELAREHAGGMPGLTVAAHLASWPTPRTGQGGKESAARKQELGRTESGGGDLQAAAELAAWATPQARDWRDGRVSPDVMDANSRPLNEQAVQYAGWPTPNCPAPHDSQHSAGRPQEAREGYGLQLPDVAGLASWQTPTRDDAGRQGSREAADERVVTGEWERTTDQRLRTQAHLAGWPTPVGKGDTTGGGGEQEAERKARGEKRPSGASIGSLLKNTALLAGWPTPVAQEDGKTPEAHLAMKQRMGERDGTHADRTAITSLAVQAQAAGWPTPMAGSPATEEYNEAGNTDSSQKTTELAHWQTPATDSFRSRSGDRKDELGLDRQARSAQPVRLTASGEMLIGSCAGMDGGGQLDPAHSRWLQGLPPEWDLAGVTALTALKKKRKQ